MPVINLVGEYHLGKNCYLHFGSKKGKMGKETIKDLADKMEQSQQELAERFSDMEDKISRSFRAVMDQLEAMDIILVLPLVIFLGNSSCKM